MDTVKLQKFLKTNTGMIFGFAALFFVAVGASWAVFSLLVKPPVSSSGVTSARHKINTNAPKTEACPINGMMYTAAEKSIWSGRRPATVMVENHVDARPINGLSKADFVYEAVAEGGITRFLAVFYCGAVADDAIAAPIRSARVYFINWASEYGDRPLYAHVGGANDFGGDMDPRADALGLLDKIGWVGTANNFDGGFSAGFPDGFSRNYERNFNLTGHEIATEHTMTLDLDKLYASAESRGFGATAKDGTVWTKGFVPYNFIADAKVANPDATDIKFDFWSSQPDYSVEWKYDGKNNQYFRFDGGKPFTDVQYNNIQLTAKNVAIMQVQETELFDPGHHMLEQNVGTGKALVFQNGTVIQATWTKNSRTDRTIFADLTGKQISFVKGVTWVEAIPAGNTVNYK